MSKGILMGLAEARKIAKTLVEDLTPHCKRIQVVGSVRRARRTVGDIEVLVEPKRMVADLFGTEEPDIEIIRRALAEIGTIRRGGDRYIQVGAAYGHKTLRVEVYLCHPPAQWGSLMAIRTGPAPLGTTAVIRMRRRGYEHVGAHVERIETGETVPTPTEDAFFELAGLACMPPTQRDDQMAQLGSQL